MRVRNQQVSSPVSSCPILRVISNLALNLAVLIHETISQKSLSHSVEVVQWVVPVDCDWFFAFLVLASVFLFHHIAMVTAC